MRAAGPACRNHLESVGCGYRRVSSGSGAVLGAVRRNFMSPSPVALAVPGSQFSEKARGNQARCRGARSAARAAGTPGQEQKQVLRCLAAPSHSFKKRRVGTRVRVGVLRLRESPASRNSRCAQDDKEKWFEFGNGGGQEYPPHILRAEGRLQRWAVGSMIRGCPTAISEGGRIRLPGLLRFHVVVALLGFLGQFCAREVLFERQPRQIRTVRDSEQRFRNAVDRRPHEAFLLAGIG